MLNLRIQSKIRTYYTSLKLLCNLGGSALLSRLANKSCWVTWTPKQFGHALVSSGHKSEPDHRFSQHFDSPSSPVDVNQGLVTDSESKLDSLLSPVDVKQSLIIEQILR